MDNIVLKQCVEQDAELRQVFCGFLLEDDVHNILGGSTGQSSDRRMNRLRLFLANTMLSRGIEQFPIAFFLNTGTHVNGGVHWQALYVDHNHMAYFFDSYGRRPNKAFNAFAHEMITISYYREYMCRASMKQALSDDEFTRDALRRCYTTKVANDQPDTCRYFPYQIQSDITNVCGEYSLIFLHNISRCATPWMHGYDYFTHYPDAFYLIPGRVASTERHENAKKRLPYNQRKKLLNNDELIRKIVLQLYTGIHLPSSILE